MSTPIELRAPVEFRQVHEGVGGDADLCPANTVTITEHLTWSEADAIEDQAAGGPDDRWAHAGGGRTLVRIDANYKPSRPGPHPVDLTLLGAVQCARSLVGALMETWNRGNLRPREAAALLHEVMGLDWALTELRELLVSDATDTEIDVDIDVGIDPADVMTAGLTLAAVETLTAAGITPIAWVRHHYDGDPWGGDECGCTDDRCITYHHDSHEPCGCLPALIETDGPAVRRAMATRRGALSRV